MLEIENKEKILEHLILKQIHCQEKMKIHKEIDIQE